jgi:DNA-binding protein HU-beta
MFDAAIGNRYQELVFHQRSDVFRGPREVLMTQAQFFQAVAEGSEVPKAQVKAVFQAVEEIVSKSLKKEGKIPLGGLGAVKLVDRKARIGRNPATGEQIKIPARTAIKITPAKGLKDVFNKKAKK